MASRVDIKDMTTLKSADGAKEIANSAIDEFEKELMAFDINYAANCGQHSTVWLHELSETLKDELESNGYIVKKNGRAADPSVHYIISGF